MSKEDDRRKEVASALTTIRNQHIGLGETCCQDAVNTILNNLDLVPVYAHGDVPVIATETNDRGKVISQETVIYHDVLVVPTQRVEGPMVAVKPISDEEYVDVIYAVIDGIKTREGSKKANDALDKYMGQVRERQDIEFYNLLTERFSGYSPIRKNKK